MEKRKGVLVIDLPNISNEDVIRFTEQLIIQSGDFMDGYKIENKNLIVEIYVKTEMK